MSNSQEELLDQIMRDQSSMENSRKTWEQHWEEVAERCLPRASGFTAKKQDGTKRSEKAIDSTPILALERFASAVESVVTPRTQTWHGLQNERFADDNEVQEYFEECTRILFRLRYAPWANFANQMSENYISIGAFGNGCMFVDELPGKGMRYACYPLQEIYFEENYQGLIDLVHRKFSLTARQAVQQFGKENLPEFIQRASENAPMTKYDFIHRVAPNDNVRYVNGEPAPGPDGMPIASFYISVSGNKLVRKGGYHTMPYCIGRYQKSPGETYARGPGMTALPDIKVLNEMNKETLIGAQLADATPEQLTILDKQFQQYALLNQLQPIYSDINTKSAGEGLASVQSIRPTGSEDDFAFRQQRYQQAIQKYQQVIGAREKDPGGWLAQNSPEVKAAYQAYQQDPSQGAQLAQAILVDKSRLGIKSKDVLPDTLADGILQQIDTSKEQSVAAIQNIAGQFGPYADQVMQQVQKKAGPVLQVVMATDNPRSANTLWQNRNVKTGDIKDAINTDNKGASDSADSEWASQSKDFATTMVNQPGGVGVWNNFNEQGRRLTYLNIQKGMSPGDAAKQAYQDVLGSQYQTQGSWRLPVKYGLDLSDVRDGANHYLENLKADQIMPLQGDPRLGDEINRQQSLSRIRDNAEWVTNADETGLMLTLNGLVVNGSNGSPITANFNDLSKAGQQNRGVMNSIGKFFSTPTKFDAKKGGMTPERALFGDNFQQGVQR